MRQFEFLEKLFSFEQTGFPFISIYLNTGPNETGKKDFDVFLKKQLKEHGSVLDAESSEAESYKADVEKIENFVEKLDPSSKGVAIFASSGSDGFFETYQFALPFEENAFDVGERPRVYPIVRLISQNPTFAVAAADTNKADIYVFKRGHTLDVQNIQHEVTNRSDVGAWSQARYQRHIDNFHQQHAKEIADELEKLMLNEKISRFFLAGDGAVIIPMLKNELSKELTEKVIDTININVDTPEHEVLEIAHGRLREKDVEQDREKVDNLMEQNYDEGLGVVGVEKTLTALLNGQVQELYLNAALDEITYNRNDIRQVLKDYEPGEEGELPNPAERAAVIDEILLRAASTAEEIRFIEDEHLLKSVGGIGALLRYQVKEVSGATNA
ncbi:MAG: hypothetical protein LC730_03365 [Acidobacteria bacterium]|nr:hypothetical protein [Acidobacteriota bacterium]MCA1608483.1 hypothetical protein [Acidobacteriota bacterium]